MTNPGLEENLPTAYCSSVKCHTLLNEFVLDGVGKIADIVVCTDTGHLLEFSEKRVTGIFNIDNCNTQSIIPFMNYKVPCLYYVIKASDKVIIVSRKDQLQLHTKYENVYKVEVNDYNIIGTPQLGMWFRGDQENQDPSVVTDFSEESEGYLPTTQGPFRTMCSSMLQELTIKVREAHLRQKEKERHRLKLFHIATHSRYDEKSEMEGRMVSLLGRKFEYVDNSHLDYLIVSDKWQRVHQGKWIIGLCISNVSSRCIKDIDLVLSNDWRQSMTYSSSLMVFHVRKIETYPGKLLKLSKSLNPMSQWKKVAELQAKECACVAGVLSLPEFMEQNKIAVSGTIKYSVAEAPSEVYQKPITSFQLRALDIVSGLLSPFSGSSQIDMDLLSVLLSSEHVSLNINKCNTEMKRILCKELSFEEKSQDILWNRGVPNSGLAGIMLLLGGTGGQSLELYIYARDASQVVLLVHCLYSILTVPVKIELLIQRDNTKPTALWEALCSEMNYLVKTIAGWNVNEEKSSDGIYKITIDRQVYSEFMSKLSVLEKTTDICHQKALAGSREFSGVS